MDHPKKERAPNNRTLALTDAESAAYQRQLRRLTGPAALDEVLDSIVNQDMLAAAPLLPEAMADLLFLDPPYNLTKGFNGRRFRQTSSDNYEARFDAWLAPLLRLLKPTASVYVCADWRTAAAVYRACSRRLKVRNRITWEREKGRGAKANWKNAAEDIWFCTVGNEYYFDVEAVKLKRRVLAPYRAGGKPKDWQESEAGGFRLTHPSNLWTDLTVPFWSMPENTEHPTQKPEKLLAKVILASCPAGGLVLDPFLGTGASVVVARKLGRRFVGIEIDEHYCCLAAKRLDLAAANPQIQGYTDGVFRERNSGGTQAT